MTETTTVKEYFKSCFEKKLLIKKGIIAAIALALVLIFSLSFFCWLKDKPEGFDGNDNGFWNICVKHNSGIGWSALSGNFPAIYTIQTLMFILLLAVFIFLTHDKITSSFIACAMFGGLFNLLQRAASADNTVLDYFQFGFWKDFPIFNWPDMFVVIGIFGFVISFITLTIIQWRREKNEYPPR